MSKKLWRVPISLEAIKELMDMTDTTILKDLIKSLDKYRKMCYTIKEKKDTNGDERLRPYQRVDVEFLKNRNAAGVFNEQRTGKTPTTLIAVEEKMKKGVVVCPAGLKLNWRNEIKRWLGREAIVISGRPSKRAELYTSFSILPDSILVISYETLRADIEFISKHLGNFDVLIADEVHRLRNYQTKQSRALYKLNKLATSVYALTGTPAVNHASDIFGILHLLRPDKFTSYWQFVERYFGYYEGRYGREVLGLNKERLSEFTNLLNDISIQRKRKDIMKWIPKITEVEIELEFTPKQLRHYNRALKEFIYGEPGKERTIPNILAQLTRLRQICVDPTLLGLSGGPSPKTQFIKEYLEDTDAPVIVFSSFTSYLNKLKEEFPDAVLLTGEQSQEEKQKSVDKIQRGEAKLLLANIRAGGVGWTLDNAGTVIFTDKSYNPVDNDQASDRFVPTEQFRTYGAKEIIHLVMEKSIEININTILERKENIISYVNTYIDTGLVDLVGKELV